MFPNTIHKLAWTMTSMALAAFLAIPAFADHAPADKLVAAGSVMGVMKECSSADPTQCGYEYVSLMEGTFKSSAPTDLYISVWAECALVTNITGKGKQSDAEGSVAQVEVWVEIDGNPVPVTHDSNGDGTYDDPDNGEVVFCNREFKIKTNLNNIIEEVCQDVDGVDECLLQFTDKEQSIELYQKTRSANSFGWIALNVGSGMHTVEVYARLHTGIDGDDGHLAVAMVGKRTLIVQPGKLANDAIH